MHKLLTPKIIFSEFIKGIFARGALAGFAGGANYCTTAEIRFSSCPQQSHLSM